MKVAPIHLPELDPQHLRLPDSGPYAARALNWILPPLQPTDVNRSEVQAAELPAANGIASARSLAKMFAAMIGAHRRRAFVEPRSNGSGALGAMARLRPRYGY